MRIEAADMPPLEDREEPVRRLDPAVRRAGLAAGTALALLLAALLWPLDTAPLPPPSIAFEGPEAGNGAALATGPFDPLRRASAGPEALPVRIDPNLAAKVPLVAAVPMLAGLMDGADGPLVLFAQPEAGWRRAGDTVLGWTIEAIGAEGVVLSRGAERLVLRLKDALGARG